MSPARSEARDGARLSIGALSRATGIPVETLRTWENRYGFPVPERKPSGHRLYPLSSVPRLRRIAQALSLGHRAGQVVNASEAELVDILETTPAAEPVTPRPLPGGEVPEVMSLVESFDAERLTASLLSEWSRATPIDFVEMRVAPLAHAVGEAWESGRLQVRHEHFLSERIGDVLRSVRLPFEERARGPLVVLATLPGEEHTLGLQMAALVLAWCGARILYLGAQTPVDETAQLARDLGARAAAVSVSVAHAGRQSAGLLGRLRASLPRRTALLVGGAGAPRAKPGMDVFDDLRGLETWARAAQPRA
jgi:methanogenic corrinoid protein MtbC1